MSRKETRSSPTQSLVRAPYLRPLIARSQQFRSFTGTSVLLKTPWAYTRVAGQRARAREATRAAAVPAAAASALTARPRGEGISAAGIMVQYGTIRPNSGRNGLLIAI